MITYVTWLKSQDATFRTTYESVTGEKIQEKPRQSTYRYMVGSSRITQAHIDQLTGVTGTPKFYTEKPTGFSDYA